MKRLLSILLTLISAVSYGQGIYTKTNTNIKQQRMAVDSVFIVPRDTAATNNARFPNIAGDPIGDSGRLAYMDGKLWLHAGNAGWKVVGSDLPDNLLDSARRSNDTLYFRTNSGSEIGIDISNVGMPRYGIVYDSVGIFKRNDQSSIIRMESGNLLAVWTAYTAETDDGDPAHIYGAESSDGGTSWHSYKDIVLNFDSIGVYVPSLYKKENGDIFLLVITANSDTTRRIFKITGNSSADSWETPVEVYNPGQYLNVASNRIFRSTSGRLFYPISVNLRGGFNSSIGVYEGKILYSDDEGDNWAEMPYSIESPDSLLVEAGLFEKNDVLTLYWRSRSGVVYAANSEDNGESFSSPYSTNLLAPNSQTSIIVDTLSGNLIAAHNDLSGEINGVTSRRSLDISYTEDGGRSWAKGYEVVRNYDSTYIEPSFFLLGQSILLLYSSGSGGETNYALHSVIVPTALIYSNATPNGNTSIRNQDTSYQPARIKIGGTITSGQITSSAHTIIDSDARSQLRIVRAASTNQGLNITAGQANATFLSYEGNGNVWGRFIFNSSRGTDTVERARIHDNGFFGLGTNAPTSRLHVAGSISFPFASTSMNLTLTTAHYTVRVTTPAVTITLPAASSASGRIYCIINYNTGGNVNLTSSGGSVLSPLNEVISVIENGVVMYFQSDGANWYRINN